VLSASVLIAASRALEIAVASRSGCLVAISQ
jgi:hypothetical protein